MARRLNSVSLSGIAAICSLAVIAGCTSGTTYGTGKSQESQLLEDLGGMVTLGGSKKERINYAARPTLVKPPAANQLPAPAETDNDQAGYFPTNPEERRVANINAIPEAEERSGNVPVEELRRKKVDSSEIQASKKSPDFSFDREESAEQRAIDSKAHRKKILEKRTALRGAEGAAPRRYLTEPPREYRTVADTAPAGEVGESETKPGVKKKVGIFDGLLKKSKDGS